ATRPAPFNHLGGGDRAGQIGSSSMSPVSSGETPEMPEMPRPPISPLPVGSCVPGVSSGVSAADAPNARPSPVRAVPAWAFWALGVSVPLEAPGAKACPGQAVAPSPGVPGVSGVFFSVVNVITRVLSVGRGESNSMGAQQVLG